MKKFSAILLTASVAVFGLFANSASATDVWTPNTPPPISSSYMNDFVNGDKRVILDEDDPYEAASSKIQVAGQSGYVCEAVDTGKCAEANSSQQVVGTSLLPVCGTAVENCIAGIDVYKQGEAPKPAKYVRNIAGYTFAARPAIGMPEGSTKSIWQSVDLAHGGGNQNYAAGATFSWKYENGAIVPRGFSMAVAGIVERPNEMSQVVKLSDCVRPHDQSVGTCQNNYIQCFYNQERICGMAQDFAVDTRIGVTLKLSNKIAGWFRGRLKDPVYNVTPIDKDFSLVTIDAQPVTVPKFFATTSAAKGDPLIDQEISNLNQDSGGSVDNTWTNHWPAASPAGLLVAQRLKAQAKDTAAGISDTWSFATIPTADEPCLADTSRLLGLVTTNAMAYSGGVPDWNGSSLSYKVAGMHYLPDGKSVVSGTYDLVMRSDVARCLYGFTKAPINATVQVVGESGETKVATVVVSEDAKTGWLKLAAYGFDFSSPTIAVKLTQAKAPAKKVTITCVGIKNKKLTKKVTAVAAKCPTGYKKK